VQRALRLRELRVTAHADGARVGGRCERERENDESSQGRSAHRRILKRPKEAAREALAFDGDFAAAGFVELRA
jgi:hypothetical protein